MNDCIFCKISNKEIPSNVIYEDDLCIAFLDLSQATDGHTLVIPKKHFVNFLDIDDDTLAHLIVVSKKLANILMDKLEADGINILSNAGNYAGQVVMHFHLHIIPRYKNDKTIAISLSDRSKEADLTSIYQKIIK